MREIDDALELCCVALLLSTAAHRCVRRFNDSFISRLSWCHFCAPEACLDCITLEVCAVRSLPQMFVCLLRVRAALCAVHAFSCGCLLFVSSSVREVSLFCIFNSVCSSSSHSLRFSTIFFSFPFPCLPFFRGTLLYPSSSLGILVRALRFTSLPITSQSQLEYYKLALSRAMFLPSLASLLSLPLHSTAATRTAEILPHFLDVLTVYAFVLFHFFFAVLRITSPAIALLCIASPYFAIGIC